MSHTLKSPPRAIALVGGNDQNSGDLMQEADILERLRLAQLYDSMWQKATDYFAQGKVRTDPHLLDLQNDWRLGMTIIARPGRGVVEQISGFLQTLRHLQKNYYTFYSLCSLW